MAKSLTEVLIESGLQPQDSSGGRKTLRCPFHNGDNEASFTIYPTETYFCFGCEVWGDAVKFLVDYKGMSNQKALEYIGIDYKTPRFDKAQVIKVRNTVQTFKFLYEVADKYHNFLINTPGAINYLYKRGLTDEIIRKYKLGYTDGRVIAIDTAYEMSLALEVGLINKSSFEMMSHRITIPNITEDGQCDFIMGRTVTNGKVKYLGLRMPKPLHGFYEVRHSPVIFVVEGHFDWLTLRQWGYPAIAMGGTHGTKFNDYLLADKKLVIIPDYDESHIGEQTAEKMKSKFAPNATILDYSELKTNDSKFDISTLAESPGGELLFNTIVSEQLSWLITSMSKRTLWKWFPNLVNMTPLRLT
jgi:DNA primase